MLRDDVVGVARLEHADRHHRGLQRIDIARHHRLQLVDDLGADQNGVDALLRPRRVAASAFELDRNVVGRRHDRTRADGEFADREAWKIVHAVDLVDGKAGDQAVFHHGLRAGAALLRRLEDHHRGAGEIARLGQIFGGSEQHRGVAVVAAGVHLAGHRRLVRQAGLLLERQRIHVGAQPNHLGAGLAATDDADDAGTADAGHHLVAAKALEFFRNRRRGAMHVVEQLRMRVHVAAPGGDLVVQVGDAIDDRHGASSLSG